MFVLANNFSGAVSGGCSDPGKLESCAFLAFRGPSVFKKNRGPTELNSLFAFEEPPSPKASAVESGCKYNSLLTFSKRNFAFFPLQKISHQEGAPSDEDQVIGPCLTADMFIGFSDGSENPDL